MLIARRGKWFCQKLKKNLSRILKTLLQNSAILIILKRQKIALIHRCNERMGTNFENDQAFMSEYSDSDRENNF